MRIQGLGIRALLPVLSSTLLASCLFGGPYTVGGTVTGLQGSGLVLHNSSGRDLTVTSSGTFTFTSGLNSGASYSVSVQTQPSNPVQTCNVANATGTISKANVTNVLVTCTQAARFAYVANRNANTISVYAIDSSSGALISVGPSVSSFGLEPIALVVEPNGKHLYVAQYASNTVSVYSIDTSSGTTSSGTLTRSEVIPTGRGPVALAIDPTNTHLYVANLTDDTVSAYRISNGTPAAIGTAFAVGRGPTALKTNLLGTVLYVTNFTDGSVSALAINQTDGSLSAVTGATTEAFPPFTSA